jgi:hypothetical protein
LEREPAKELHLRGLGLNLRGCVELPQRIVDAAAQAQSETQFDVEKRLPRSRGVGYFTFDACLLRGQLVIPLAQRGLHPSPGLGETVAIARICRLDEGLRGLRERCGLGRRHCRTDDEDETRGEQADVIHTQDAPGFYINANNLPGSACIRALLY